MNAAITTNMNTAIIVPRLSEEQREAIQDGIYGLVEEYPNATRCFISVVCAAVVAACVFFVKIGFGISIACGIGSCVFSLIMGSIAVFAGIYVWLDG